MNTFISLIYIDNSKQPNIYKLTNLQVSVRQLKLPILSQILLSIQNIYACEYKSTLNFRSFDSQTFQRTALPHMSWMPSGQWGHVSSWTWWSPCVVQWQKEEEDGSVMCKQHASSELPLQLHFSDVERNRGKQSDWFWNEPFFLSEI